MKFDIKHIILKTIIMKQKVQWQPWEERKYQASIDSDREITTNAEVDSLTKRAAGPATNSLDKGSRSGCTNALCHRKFSKDKVIRARHRHTLHRQGLRPSNTFCSRSLAKPNLKHLSHTTTLSLSLLLHLFSSIPFKTNHVTKKNQFLYL